MLAWATTLLGWAVSREGRPEDGIVMIRRGTAATQETGSEQFRPYFLTLLAHACAAAGRPAEGLAAVTEALATAARTGERFYEAEMYRLKGELRGRRTPADVASAEECLVRAIEIARRQGAQTLELRAALSLSRLWRDHGREADARPMLLAICGGFSEGLDTVDLREARAMLSEMPASTTTSSRRTGRHEIP